MINTKQLVILAGLAFVAATSQAAIVVPGTSDPWLANGGIDPAYGGEPADTVPAQAPVSFGTVTPGTTLTWTATGQVGHPSDVAGPDGATGALYTHQAGAINGIPDVSAPVEIDALMGVFTGPGYASIFKMGSSGSAVVPAGATKFYLGTMDGYGWANNVGQFDVCITAVPEPSTYLAGLSALGMLGIFGWRSRK